MRYGLLFVALLVVAATASSCGSGGSTPPTARVIRLAENPWSGSRVDTAVAAQLLREELGYPVEIAEVDEYAQWPAIARGELHACLEVWPSGHAADIAQYIDGERSVDNAGLLDVVGKIGWYVPAYVIAAHPELASWEGFLEPQSVALFRTPETGSAGQFLAGDPSWVQFDADIIANLGLDFDVVFAGSETALLDRVAEAYQAEQPLLFYFWTPHAAHSRYALTEVQLPPYSAECYAMADRGGVDCDYPADLLFKIVWSGLDEYAPRAHEFLSRFNWSTQTQTELLAAVDVEGLTPEEAARRWIADNEPIWREWLPPR